jgi:hypothetical protein
MEDPMEDMDPMEDPMEEDCTLACQATEGRTARPSCLPASGRRMVLTAAQ